MKEEALDRTMCRNRFARGFGPVVRQITDNDDLTLCTLLKPRYSHDKFGIHNPLQDLASVGLPPEVYDSLGRR